MRWKSTVGRSVARRVAPHRDHFTRCHLEARRADDALPKTKPVPASVWQESAVPADRADYCRNHHLFPSPEMSSAFLAYRIV
jgi:hypothetical protein